MKKLILLIMSSIFLVGCSSEFVMDSINPSDSVTQTSQRDMVMTNVAQDEAVQDSGSQDIIYRSHLTFETVNFEDAKENLQNMLTDDIVVEYESETSHPSGDNTVRNLSMQLRVPQAENQSVLDQLAELEGAELIHLQKGSEDVTKTIQDQEVRLSSVEARINRLEELLDEAENVSDIVEIEVALNEAIFERDQILSDLAYWEDQVDMSTINVELREVLVYQDGSESQISVWDRIVRYLGVLGEYILIALQNGVIAVFFLLPILLLIGIVLYIRRRRNKGK